MPEDLVTKTSSLVRCGFSIWILALSWFPVSAASLDQNLDKTFQVTSGGKLVVDADRGSIAVKPDGGDQVKIRVFREVKNASKAEADRILADHEVRFIQEGNTVSVTAKSKDKRWLSGFRQPSLQVRYEISVPARCSVDLRTSGGNITLPELEGDATTRTSSGLIDLGTISGRMEASNSGGDIRIGQAGGDLAARTSSGSIKVREAKGKAEMSNSGGDIRVEKAAAEVTAATSSGSIILGPVSGKINARNSGGDIKIESAGGDLEAQTSSGSIRVGDVKGEKVSLKNSGGNIAVGQVLGSLFAQTSSGAIELKAANGKIEVVNSGGDISVGDAGSGITAKTSSGIITIKTARGKLDARNSGGDIRIGTAEIEAVLATSSGAITVSHAKGRIQARNSGGQIAVEKAGDVVQASTSSAGITVGFVTPLKGECRLETSGGAVNVSLPENSAVNLDARASGGDVISDLPVTVTVAQTGQTHGSLQGKINGGGPALVLRSSAGDIRIHKSAASTAMTEAEDPAK